MQAANSRTILPTSRMKIHQATSRARRLRCLVRPMSEVDHGLEVHRREEGMRRVGRGIAHPPRHRHLQRGSWSLEKQMRYSRLLRSCGRKNRHGACETNMTVRATNCSAAARAGGQSKAGCSKVAADSGRRARSPWRGRLENVRRIGEVVDGRQRCFSAGACRRSHGSFVTLILVLLHLDLVRALPL